MHPPPLRKKHHWKKFSLAPRPFPWYDTKPVWTKSIYCLFTCIRFHLISIHSVVLGNLSFFSHHRRLFSVVYDIPSFFVPNRTSFLFWAHWKQMMIMVGCDHYDEPFNLVNNDNPDYLKISRACCTGTMSAGGPDIQRVSRIIRGDREL